MKKPCIVIVDDDSSIVESFKIILSHEGYETSSAENGRELYALLKRTQPDLILMDYSLPGETGGILTKNLKEDPDYADTPVIIISANDKFRIPAKAAGADDFLEKPIEIPVLLSRIRKFLS